MKPLGINKIKILWILSLCHHLILRYKMVPLSGNKYKPNLYEHKLSHVHCHLTSVTVFL